MAVVPPPIDYDKVANMTAEKTAEKVWSYSTRKLTSYYYAYNTCTYSGSPATGYVTDPDPDTLRRIKELKEVTIEIVDIREADKWWYVDVFIHELGGLMTLRLPKAEYKTLEPDAIFEIAKEEINRLRRKAEHPLIGKKAKIKL